MDFLIRFLARKIARRLEKRSRLREQATYGRAVRITNYNHALVPFAFSLLLLAFPAVLGTLAIRAGQGLAEGVWMLLVFVIGSLVAFVLGTRRILSVTLDEKISVRRLFSLKMYDSADVLNWQEIEELDCGTSDEHDFVLCLNDGTVFRRTVSPRVAAQIAERFIHLS